MNIAPTHTRAFAIAESIPATGSWVVLDIRDMGKPITPETIVVGPTDQQTAASHALYWNERGETEGRYTTWVAKPYPQQ